MVRSVLAHPHRVLADPTAVSPKCVKKATGAEYTGGSDQKEDVNRWLAEVAGSVFGTTVGWGLLLETKAMTTLRWMKDGCGLLAERVVVPNPGKEDCEALRAAGCHVYEGTSHGMLAELCEGGSNRFCADLRSCGFSTFDVVWLDYCGTIMTTAGRKRQMDILHLFQHGLLSPKSLLAVTFCVRGSRNMYRDQVADTTRKLVFSIAESTSATLTLVGTATYSSKSGPIHTLAFVKGVGLVDVWRLPRLEAKYKYSRITYERAFQRRSVLLRVWCHVSKGDARLWGFMRDVDWRRGTPHFDAVCVGAEVFARAVAGSGGRRAFALDVAMLPVTKKCQALGVSVETVLEDVMDAEPGYPHKDITNNYVAEMDGSYDGVWLSYLARKPYPTRMLRRCDEWGDLRNLLENNIMGTTLALAIPYVEAVEPWADCCIDWIVHGVQTACKTHNYPILRPIYLSKWVLGTPHAVVVFTAKECASIDSSIIAVPGVKHWEMFTGWDLERKKRPAAHGLKFKAVAEDVRKIVPVGEEVTVHEPGGFYVLPQYSKGVYISHDALEAAELSRRGFSTTVAPTAPHLVILTNEGTSPFATTWVPTIQRWLALGLPEQTLVVFVEVSHHHLFEEMLDDLKGLSEGHGDVSVTRVKAMMHAARRWELATVVYRL